MEVRVPLRLFLGMSELCWQKGSAKTTVKNDVTSFKVCKHAFVILIFIWRKQNQKKME